MIPSIFYNVGTNMHDDLGLRRTYKVIGDKHDAPLNILGHRELDEQRKAESPGEVQKERITADIGFAWIHRGGRA